MKAVRPSIVLCHRGMRPLEFFRGYGRNWFDPQLFELCYRPESAHVELLSKRARDLARRCRLSNLVSLENATDIGGHDKVGGTRNREDALGGANRNLPNGNQVADLRKGHGRLARKRSLTLNTYEALAAPLQWHMVLASLISRKACS
jgi:hypothetical protein